MHLLIPSLLQIQACRLISFKALDLCTLRTHSSHPHCKPRSVVFSPLKHSFNLFTAPDCKISGLKGARTRLKNSIVFGLITNMFSMLCVLTKTLSHAGAKKENKKAEGFQVLHFYWSFSNDIMAVKGLKPSIFAYSALTHPFPITSLGLSSYPL